MKFTSTHEFDFTKLDNYIAPENTFSDTNESWAARRSAFYSIEYESFISEGACVRKNEREIEIGLVPCPFNHKQMDALRDCASRYSEPDSEALNIVDSLGITHFFRYRTVVTSRYMSGLAVVKDNKLIFVYSI